MLQNAFTDYISDENVDYEVDYRNGRTVKGFIKSLSVTDLIKPDVDVIIAKSEVRKGDPEPDVKIYFSLVSEIRVFKQGIVIRTYTE